MTESTTDTQIALIEQSMSAMNQTMTDMKTDHEKLLKAVNSLTDQWSQAQGAIAFAKWALGFLTAVGAFGAVIKLKLFGGHP